MTRKLTFPVPSRCWVQGPEGWFNKRWDELEVLDCKMNGGWFQKGKHEFASLKAAKAAGVNDD